MENSRKLYGSHFFQKNIRAQGVRPQADLINRIINRQSTETHSSTMPPEKRRYSEVEPPLGQPGGRDDPFRRGLNGSCTKWYLRFIRQGCSGEEARRRALEHRQMPPPFTCGTKRSNDVPPSTDEMSKKPCGNMPPRPLKEINSNTVNLKKLNSTAADDKNKAAGTPIKSVEATKKPDNANKAEKKVPQTKLDLNISAVANINVAIRAVGYPQKLLTNRELSELKMAILMEIVKGSKVALRFDGIHLKPGYLVIECHGDDPANWLINVAPMLSNWKGAPLEAIIADAIPSSNSMELFLPGSAGASTDFLLGLLQVQNRLCTDAWKVLSKRDEGDGCLMTIAIDDLSMENLVANKKIWFRYGTIPTKVLSKQTEEDKQPKAVEAITAPTVDLTDDGLEEPAKSDDVKQDVAGPTAAEN